MVQCYYARGFRDLIVYQKSREVAKRIFEITKDFPREELYSLTDQVRRCSRSVGAQIAEAWAKRKYEKHFVNKLTDADGEQQETQHWLDIATDYGYITEDLAERLNNLLAEIGRMLNGMIDKSSTFCGETSQVLRESAPEYFLVNDLSLSERMSSNHSPVHSDLSPDTG